MHTRMLLAVARRSAVSVSASVRPAAYAMTPTMTAPMTATTKPSSYTPRRLSSFDARPSPVRLPPAEQAEFERLLQEASESVAAAELADAVRLANAQAAAAEADLADVLTEAKALADAAVDVAAVADAIETTAATPAGTSGNPVEGVWRGAPPEFEGERNPKTGEIGGPKNEPLRWGSTGDWSFNGRATDF